jgi:hypothetical protein
MAATAALAIFNALMSTFPAINGTMRSPLVYRVSGDRSKGLKNNPGVLQRYVTYDTLLPDVDLPSYF